MPQRTMQLFEANKRFNQIIIYPPTSDLVHCKDLYCLNKKCMNVFDINAKSTVLWLVGSYSSSRLQVPANGDVSLGIEQRYLVVQACIPSEENFVFEILINDYTGLRKRLSFSTIAKGFVVTSLRTTVPLKFLPRNKWINLCLDLQDLTEQSCPSFKFKALRSIAVYPNCKLRSIFTLRDIDFLENEVVDLPKNLQFPPRVEFESVLLTTETVVNYLRCPLKILKGTEVKTTRMYKSRDITTTLRSSNLKSKSLPLKLQHSKSEPQPSVKTLTAELSSLNISKPSTDYRAPKFKKYNSGKYTDLSTPRLHKKKRITFKDTPTLLGSKTPPRKGISDLKCVSSPVLSMEMNKIRLLQERAALNRLALLVANIGEQDRYDYGLSEFGIKGVSASEFDDANKNVVAKLDSRRRINDIFSEEYSDVQPKCTYDCRKYSSET